MLENIMIGITAAFQIQNCLYAFGGCALGILFGALPGVSATMGVAVLIPLSYSLDTVPALILLAAVYCGATYGGSISAILINTPGTPANAATAIDGYAMTKKGLGKEALVESVVASTWGGLISAVALLFIAPPLARFSLKFGPWENALMAIFGLSIIASLSSHALLKGFLGGLFGILIGCVGLDPIYGQPRFTFGNFQLLNGIAFVPALVGLYSISQVLVLVTSNQSHIVDKSAIQQIKKKKIKFKDLVRYPKTYVISSIIGVVIGIVPGAGGQIASYLAYNQAKRTSKHPEEYGTGSREAVASAESSNNGVTGGSLIPMLTLGIPGNSTAAIMMGALMMKGLFPGNDLFTGKGYITYPFIIGFFIANIAMLIWGLYGSSFFSQIIRTPREFLAAGILGLTVIGSFAINNNIFDVYVMLIFGVIGYLLKQVNIEATPIVLGMILGPIAERGLAQSISISGGLSAALLAMLTRPICIVLILASVASVALPLWQDHKAKKKQEEG